MFLLGVSLGQQELPSEDFQLLQELLPIDSLLFLNFWNWRSLKKSFSCKDLSDFEELVRFWVLLASFKPPVMQNPVLSFFT